ncbi:MAG: flagellar basal body L-ring protein FlgH [Leptospirales bacterium]|nr:flagellar basal body L-ring protein FlgH [Leptospirales bacterium]
MRWIKYAVIILFFAVFAYSATVWQDRDIYSTDKNLQVGDIIVVNVRDLSKLKFEIALKNNSSSDILSNPDMTITGFLPKIASNKNIKNNESTNYNGNSKLEFSIAARITARQPNGLSTITGTRVYSFNGVSNAIVVTGVIDPKQLSAGTINSEQVADFMIQITERKEGLTITKPPLAEGETVNAELTDAEKQQILIDYLEKMIRELTR